VGNLAQFSLVSCSRHPALRLIRPWPAFPRAADPSPARNRCVQRAFRTVRGAARQRLQRRERSGFGAASGAGRRPARASGPAVMHPPRTPRAARTAYSGRRSPERRPPCAAPNQSHRLQSRERSGFGAASGAGRRPARASGPAVMHPPRTPRAARTAYSGRRSGERRPPFARLRIPSEAHSEPRVKPSEGRRERAVTTGSGFRTASGASPRPAGARGPKPRFPPALAHSEGDSLN